MTNKEIAKKAKRALRRADLPWIDRNVFEQILWITTERNYAGNAYWEVLRFEAGRAFRRMRK